MLLVCFILVVSPKKKNPRMIETVPNNNNGIIRLGYPSTQPANGYNSRYNNSNVSNPTNISAQPNNRSAFVVAENSAYNYDMNKICKRYLILMHC